MPIVTLTTDFGTADHYVAAMKAVLLAACPAATPVEVTHHVPRQDVTAGAFTLEQAVAASGPARSTWPWSTPASAPPGGCGWPTWPGRRSSAPTTA